jgi:cell division protein FtsB
VRTAAPSPVVTAGHTTRALLRRAPRRRRVRLTARATVLLMLMGAVLALSVAPARMYFDQKAELADLDRQKAILERQTEDLATRASQLRDQAYLERLARQCLGMVRPGETAFVAVPREGAPAPPPEC